MTLNRIYARFEVVKDEARKYPDAKIHLPERQTSGSMAYDFYLPADLTLFAGEKATVFTDVKCKLPDGFGLLINVRSSIGRQGIHLQNTQGWIDRDYYSNPDNDGNIGFLLENTNSEAIISLHKGDRIAQGMIVQFFVMQDDQAAAERFGGFGSTDKKTDKKEEEKPTAPVAKVFPATKPVKHTTTALDNYPQSGKLYYCDGYAIDDQAELIGEFANVKEESDMVEKFLKDRKIDSYYLRRWVDENEKAGIRQAFYDFGSHTHFLIAETRK